MYRHQTLLCELDVILLSLLVYEALREGLIIHVVMGIVAGISEKRNASIVSSYW